MRLAAWLDPAGWVAPPGTARARIPKRGPPSTPLRAWCLTHTGLSAMACNGLAAAENKFAALNRAAGARVEA